MKPYHDLLRDVLQTGELRGDRTGTGVRSVFGRQCRYDLARGFPLLTTKKVHFKSVVHELLWFLRGETNVASLRDAGVSIWDEWADERGDLGRVYGAQWRSWRGPGGRVVDQISEVVERIRREPESRRLVVSAWNPGELDDMALPPCHALFQFYVHGSEPGPGRLSCQLYQRSADLFLGVPFNIASYALLTHMIARVTGLGVGEFVHTIGDAHIYRNHEGQVRELLSRAERPPPVLVLSERVGPGGSVLDFAYEDVRVEGYDPHPAIRAPVAV